MRLSSADLLYTRRGDEILSYTPVTIREGTRRVDDEEGIDAGKRGKTGMPVAAYTSNDGSHRGGRGGGGGGERKGVAVIRIRYGGGSSEPLTKTNGTAGDADRVVRPRETCRRKEYSYSRACPPREIVSARPFVPTSVGRSRGVTVDNIANRSDGRRNIVSATCPYTSYGILELFILDKKVIYIY